MRTPEKNKRLRNLHSKVRVSDQSIRRVKMKLEELIEKRGIEVDDDLHQDLTATISENSEVVESQNPHGSFLRIFWNQQQKASKYKNAKSMRWAPAMIRYLYF